MKRWNIRTYSPERAAQRLARMERAFKDKRFRGKGLLYLITQERIYLQNIIRGGG